MSPAQATSSRLPDLRHVSRPRSRAARRSRAVRGYAWPSESLWTRWAVTGRRTRSSPGRGRRRADGIEPILFGSEEVDPAARPGPRGRPRSAGRRDAREARRRSAREARQLAVRGLPRGRRGARPTWSSRPATPGAMLAAGLLEIGRLPEVSRPAIAAPLPARRGPSILIDAGANADARPEHLLQFAHMGTIFAEEIIGIRDPRSGCSRSARSRRRATGSPVSRTACCLRTESASSGTSKGGSSWRAPRTSSSATASRATCRSRCSRGRSGRCSSRSARRSSPRRRGKVGGLMIRPAFRGLRRRLDPDTYGGGYLLGLKGLAVVAHGNSSRPAIVSAIQLGARGVSRRRRRADGRAARIARRGGPSVNIAGATW